MSATVYWDQRPQTPVLYIPIVLQFSRCQQFWHTCTNCHSDGICRYSSGSHAYNECTHAHTDTDYKKPNHNKICANCLGTYGVKYQGLLLPPAQQGGNENSHQEKPILQKAFTEFLASTQLTETDKGQLQGQIHHVRTKVEVALHINQESQQNTRELQHILKEMKTPQEMTQNDVLYLTEMKVKTEETQKEIQEERLIELVK